MRLTEQQQRAIVETFLEVFGKGELLLFGSRTDDAAKGGDIDLYINPDDQQALGEKRIDYLARLKREIGEQKIDLVIKREPLREIDRIAAQEGILLCQHH